MKQYRAAVLAIAAAALTAGAPLKPERYEFDTAHTNIGFTVRHLAVTNVKGRFNKFAGELLFDQADITKSSVRVTISAASIDTENDRRDNHLRSGDFFEVAKFPDITFVSKRIQKQGKTILVHGDLTIRDVTRPVAIPFEIRGPIVMPNGQKKLGVGGTLTINRFDYGLKYNRMTEAVAVVGQDVQVTLDVQAHTPSPAAAR